jgi:hypothetical protein
MTNDEMRKALQEPLFDSAIVRHGFAVFLRDYDVVAEVNKRQFLYRFSHCTSATVTTAVAASVWLESWADIYTNYAAWVRAGGPDGYVWGVCYSLAYPGAAYVENSAVAQEWAVRLGKPMHEVLIETNGHNLRLIFHDLSVRELKDGDEEWIKERVVT